MINESNGENNLSSDYGNYIIYRGRVNLLTLNEPAESSASKCERYISGYLPHVADSTTGEYYRECILSYLEKLRDNGCQSFAKDVSFEVTDKKMKKKYRKRLQSTSTLTKRRPISMSPNDNEFVFQTCFEMENKTLKNNESRENIKTNILENILLFSRSLESASKSRKRRKKWSTNEIKFVDNGNEGDVSDSEPDVIDDNIVFEKSHAKAVEEKHKQNMPLNRKLDFLEDWESSKSCESEKSCHVNVENYREHEDLEISSCGSDTSLIFSQSEHEYEFEALLDSFEGKADLDDTRNKIRTFLNNWCPSDNDDESSNDLRRKITKAKLKSLRIGLILEDMLYRLLPDCESRKKRKQKMAKCLMDYAELAQKINAGGADSSRKDLEKCIRWDEFIANEESTVGEIARKKVKWPENDRKVNNVNTKTKLKRKYNRKQKEHEGEYISQMDKLKANENIEQNQQSPEVVRRKSLRISSQQQEEKKGIKTPKASKNIEKDQQSPEVSRRKSLRISSQEKHEKREVYPTVCYIHADTDSHYRMLSNLLNSSITTTHNRKRRKGVAVKKKNNEQECNVESVAGEPKLLKSTTRKFGSDLDNKLRKNLFVEDKSKLGKIIPDKSRKYNSEAVGKENCQLKSAVPNDRNCSSNGSKKRKLFSMDNWIDSPEYFNQFLSNF